MSKQTVFVAEDGNRRTEISVDDVIQAVVDIEGWMKSNARDLADMLNEAPGATDGQLRTLRELFGGRNISEHLEAVLQLHNGGIQLYEFDPLNVDDMIKIAEQNMGQGKWEDNLVPIGRDLDGYLLVLDDGKVCVWGPDEGILRVEAGSYGHYLERLRDEMLSHRVEYVEGCGLVQCADC